MGGISISQIAYIYQRATLQEQSHALEFAGSTPTFFASCTKSFRHVEIMNSGIFRNVKRE